jgi:hypothetical protein
VEEVTNDGENAASNGAKSSTAIASEHSEGLAHNHPEPLSPGYAGVVINPIIRAEFRRWRARPLTYLAIVALAFAGIWYTLSYRSDLQQFVTAQPGIGSSMWGQFGLRMVDLIVRPSTIIPLLMTWRALVSFRPSGLYQPFRTTFLTPGEFLWGIITIPFAVSLLVIMIYTGVRLLPEGTLLLYYSVTPEMRAEQLVHPFWAAFGVLFEGAANGAVICLAALYFGLLFRARPEALVPIVAFLLVIQAGQAFYYVNEANNRTMTTWVVQLLTGEEDPMKHVTLAAMSQYLAMGVPKLGLCFVFWALTTWHLRARDMP